MAQGPETNPKVRRALLAGLTVEGVLLTGGVIYLLATGMYLRPMPWVALVVMASVVGLVVGVTSYLRAGR